MPRSSATPNEPVEVAEPLITPLALPEVIFPLVEIILVAAVICPPNSTALPSIPISMLLEPSTPNIRTSPLPA